MDKIKEVFQKHYQDIIVHGSYKFTISREQSINILHDVYISIDKTITNNKKEHDFSTEKKILNYIYYCYSSRFHELYKKQERKKELDTIFHEKISADTDEVLEKTEIELQKEKILNYVFEYLNKEVQERTHEIKISDINIAIFKFYLYNNLSPLKIKEKINMSRWMIDYSIKSCIEIINESKEVTKLYIELQRLRDEIE